MWKNKVLPRSPTARRQTVGAWESCWMLQSWLPHNLTMPFVGRDTKLSQRHPVRKAPLFLAPSPFYMHDLATITVPERFLARCGRCDRRNWHLKVIRHCSLSTSQVFKSFFLSLIFSHISFFSPSKVISFATEPRPCPACLHSCSQPPFAHVRPWASCPSASCDGGVWFPSHAIKEMEPKSAHTWSRDGVGFLQGPRAISLDPEPFWP